MTKNPLQTDLVQETAPRNDFNQTVIKNGKPIVILISPENADKVTKNIGILIKEISLRAFETGAQCDLMLTTHGWAYNHDTLNEYIACLGFGRRHFFNFVRLHRLWETKISRVIDKCVDIMLHTPWTKIITVAKHLENAETDDEIIQVLHDAHVLSESDLAIAYGKAKPVLNIPDGKFYKIVDRGHGRYDITLSDCRLSWQVDGQIWWQTFQRSGGRIKGCIEALDVKDIENNG